MPQAQAPEGETLRCWWVSSGEQCRYFGAHSEGTKGEGPWYCSKHRLCHDQAEGAAIVHRSIEEVPVPDYSYEARRAAFLARPPLKATTWGICQQIRDEYRKSSAARVGLRPMSEHIEREPGED